MGAKLNGLTLWINSLTSLVQILRASRLRFTRRTCLTIANTHTPSAPIKIHKYTVKDVALRARLHWVSVNAAILLETWLNKLLWCLNKPSKSLQNWVATSRGFITKGWIAYLLLIRMILRLNYKLWKGSKKDFWMDVLGSAMFLCRHSQVHTSSWRHYDVIICSSPSGHFRIFTSQGSFYTLQGANTAESRTPNGKATDLDWYYSRPYQY